VCIKELFNILFPVKKFFNTLPFYTSWLSPKTYHPVARPHWAHV
jgi:hypothetical protein